MLTLFMRAGCPLCDEARDELSRLRLSWIEVDVDGDKALQAQYGERVPVIERDGEVVAEGNLERVALRSLLGGA